MTHFEQPATRSFWTRYAAPCALVLLGGCTTQVDLGARSDAGGSTNPSSFHCGDGIVQLELGEACDDGNTVSGDGCSATCTVEVGWTCPAEGQPCVQGTTCGDGIVQVDAGEQCDEGANNGKGVCTTSCKLARAAVCGDGVLSAGEACDDGNTIDSDGCSSTCTVEVGWTCPAAGQPCVQGTTCGDGIVQMDAGEQCDEGANNGKGSCTTSCELVRAAVCGDGVLGTGEACDDGNTMSGDGCSATCTVEPGWGCAVPGRPCARL